MVDALDCFGALSMLRQRQRSLNLDFEPDVPHVGPALFPLKKSIVEQCCCFVELSSLREIQDKFVHKRCGHGDAIGILLQRSDALLWWTPQNTQSLINSGVESDICWVRAQTFLKYL